MQPEEDNLHFSQCERIKSSLTIKSVIDERRGVMSYPIRCFYRYVEGTPCAQLAVVVPKRRFKHAVDRNRGKRLLREAFRLNKQLLPVGPGKSLQMCWIYVGKELVSWKEINTAVQQLYSKIENSRKS